jgi:hypothetical protein
VVNDLDRSSHRKEVVCIEKVVIFLNNFVWKYINIIYFIYFLNFIFSIILKKLKIQKN